MTTTENVDNAAVMASPAQSQSVVPMGEQPSWLERTLKPKTYKPRYPFVGKPLLWMTCAFGSLGDALFGYNQGMPALVVDSGMLVTDCAA